MATDAASGASILIVEDDPALQQAFKMILEFKGFNVRAANNGIEGLEAMKAQLPDLILLDMLMPKMDGLEFLQHADIPAQHPKVKVILLSNFSDSEREIDLERLGVSARHLKSDVTPLTLIEIVRRTIGSE